MNSRPRKTLFALCWGLALIVGVTVLGVAGIAAVAGSWYASLLGGKPLPALTELVLQIHTGRPELLLAAMVAGVSTHALAVHWLVCRQNDGSQALWLWNLLAVLTALGLVIYFVICVLALLLPGLSFIAGMELETPESLARERGRWMVFGMGSMAAFFYALGVGWFMWRSGGKK